MPPAAPGNYENAVIPSEAKNLGSCKIKQLRGSFVLRRLTGDVLWLTPAQGVKKSNR
jgi:hypothetical protein